MNTVSEQIFRELDFFAVSFVLGALLVFVYDCLRIFRRMVRHGVLWISLEDFCYWVAVAFAVFAMLYQKNDGLIRGFSIGGVMIGMLFYNQLVSRYVVRCTVRFLKKITGIGKKICGFVFAPFRKAAKTASRAVCGKSRTFISRQRKKVKFMNNRLKKMKKEVKMGLTKK